MSTDLKNLEYLWDGTAPQWILMKLDSSSSSPRFLIMNADSKSAKIIEDDVLAKQVIEKMLAAGVRVMSPGQTPKGNEF